jgi:eukaryotic-like serine/threonine-protein kinase
MASDLKPNTDLLHYRLVSKIGGGGMGEVYLAEDTRLGRKVAIKFLTDEFSHVPDKLQRFVQEAKAASALNHPNILTVYEIGEADGKNYIATELIEGQTLREHISPDTSMPVETVLRLAVQIAEALDAAHRAGIIHRDIKPENVMVRSDGYVKVLDFGLAKLAEPDADDVGSEETTRALVHTTPGLVMGTVSYMSPEQARGRNVDKRTDIFSLGVVMYEMLAGRQPFIGDTASHVIVAILEKQPPAFTSAGLEVPVDLEKIVLCALEKDPARRYQNVSEMAAELGQLYKRLQFEAEFKTPEATTQILREQPEPANTIAVLPFVNMSRAEDSDYFSDGIAEELINVLSKIRGLSVAARTSAFSFKGKQTTVGDIGRALNVASVLEGSVRMAGNRVRIAVQLVNTADGYHIWSDTYDRTMDDIFALQDDIAGSVVGELRSRLLGETSSEDVEAEVAEAVRGRSDEPEAQRLMLLGRYFIDRTTPKDTEKAVAYLREALEIDPEFALGWAELARAHAVQAGKAWVPFDEGFARSREAVDKALEIEPELAEAHALLGRIKSAYELDLKGARASYAKALELAPGSPVVMDGASVLEFKFGNYDEALALSRKVLSQDPLSGSVWHNLGMICHAAGLLDEAERAFRRALELGTHRMVSTAMLSLVLLDEGRGEEALGEARHEPDEYWQLWARSIILHRLGRDEDAGQALEELTSITTDGDAYQLAEVFSARGETEKAFEWLERAVALHDPGVTHAKASPCLRPLHEDPRWASILKQIGFD